MCISESGYGSETSLRRHPSLGSLASTASASVASTGSFKVIIPVDLVREEMSLVVERSQFERETQRIGDVPRIARATSGHAADLFRRLCQCRDPRI